MEDQVGLTLACLNIKKLVKWIGNIPFYFVLNSDFRMEYQMMRQNIFEKRKRQTPKMTFVFVLSNNYFSCCFLGG